jgi:hypothetical protein
MAGVTFTSNTLTPPIWAGDFLSREHLLPGGAKLLASAFLREDAVVVTLNGSAAQGATSVTVDALSGAIPSGTVLHFNSTEFLITTLEDDDTATYTGVGDYAVRSGTLVGRTFAERASGTAFGPWAASDDEVYLVVYDVLNVTTNNDVELYRPNSLVKENFLPDWGDTAVWTTGALAALRATYTTTRGAA